MQSTITITVNSEKDLSDDDVRELSEYIKNGCAIFSVQNNQSPLIGAKLVFCAHRNVSGSIQVVQL
jgi:hypothetical protein